MCRGSPRLLTAADDGAPSVTDIGVNDRTENISLEVLTAAETMRGLLRRIYLTTLAEISVAAAFGRHVNYDRGVLRIGDDLYDLDAYARVLVISIGKAAHSMVSALAGQLGSRMEGIVASPVAPAEMLPKFTYFQGGHPYPNEESLRGASAILHALGRANENTLIIFLLSGGGSAVVEKPLYESISLQDLIETYRVLVGCGAPITGINTIRKHLSAVKGGRLAQAAAPAQQVSILVSDVPDDQFDALASGPTMPDGSTAEDCYRIAAEYDLVRQLPDSVAALFRQRALEPTAKSDDPAFVRARWWPILSSDAVAKLAAKKTAEQGFAVEIDNSCDDWEYSKAADYLLERLRALRRGGTSRVCLVSAGEVTVRLGPAAGQGGRNQQFALYCARKIAGEKVAVLSAGTDGVDGNSDAAGAIADGTTLKRARAAGLNLDAALANFDAHPLLAKLGDAIVTGPTGNNVRDLRALLAY